MDPSVTETYMGEWKNDKRTGFGVSERSDGLKYEGEWYCNKKYGYGVTTFSNGEKEEGKYKNNVLITSKKKKPLFMMRSATFRERIDAAVSAAQRASKIALQKADIAITRTATARGKAEQADYLAAHARTDSDVAQEIANQYAPDFKQPGLEKLKALKEKFKYVDTLYKQKEANLSNNITTNQMPINKTNQNQIQMNHHQTIQPPKLTIPNAVPNEIPNKIPTNQMQFNNQTNAIQNENYQQNFNTNLMMNNNPTSNPNPIIKTVTIAATNQYSNEKQITQQTEQTITTVNLQNTRIGRNSIVGDDVINPPISSLRRGSRRVSGDRPYLSTTGQVSQQSSIDHFDHYKRPPSRDSSVDRYSRATGRLSAGGSRQPSIDRTAGPSETPDRTLRAPSVMRGTTPAPLMANNNSAKNGSITMGNAINNPIMNVQQIPPFEEIIIKKKSLGQDIIPSLNQPKRTESLYVAGNAAPGPKVFYFLFLKPIFFYCRWWGLSLSFFFVT